MTGADVVREREARGWSQKDLAKRCGYTVKTIKSIEESMYNSWLNKNKTKILTDVFNWSIDRNNLLGFDIHTANQLSYTICLRAVRDYCELKEGIQINSADSNIAELEDFFTGDLFAALCPSVDGEVVLEKLQNSKELRLHVIRMIEDDDGRRKVANE